MIIALSNIFLFNTTHCTVVQNFKVFEIERLDATDSFATRVVSCPLNPAKQVGEGKNRMESERGQRTFKYFLLSISRGSERWVDLDLRGAIGISTRLELIWNTLRITALEDDVKTQFLLAEISIWKNGDFFVGDRLVVLVKLEEIPFKIKVKLNFSPSVFYLFKFRFWSS